MVVRKLEIPPAISSGPQLDSKFQPAGGIARARTRHEATTIFQSVVPARCRHACMRKTYFVRKPRK
jgi:hypothetical protein